MREFYIADSVPNVQWLSRRPLEGGTRRAACPPSVDSPPSVAATLEIISRARCEAGVCQAGRVTNSPVRRRLTLTSRIIRTADSAPSTRPDRTERERSHDQLFAKAIARARFAVQLPGVHPSP
ncbi:unnamed protein product, partial [Iphiclides podalirius]